MAGAHKEKIRTSSHKTLLIVNWWQSWKNPWTCSQQIPKLSGSCVRWGCHAGTPYTSDSKIKHIRWADYLSTSQGCVPSRCQAAWASRLPCCITLFLLPILWQQLAISHLDVTAQISQEQWKHWNYCQVFMQLQDWTPRHHLLLLTKPLVFHISNNGENIFFPRPRDGSSGKIGWRLLV